MSDLGDNNKISKIIRSVRTEEERDVLHECIEVLERSLYRTRTPDLDEVFKLIPPKMVDLLREVLPSYSDEKDQIEVRRSLMNLKEELAKLRTLRLELAFEPNVEAIERLSGWVLKELGEGILLEMGHEPSILGGARIIFGGRYRELTLLQMLNSALEREWPNIFKKLRPLSHT